MHVTAQVWKSEYNLEQVLSFYHRVPEGQTHAINFGSVMANLGCQLDYIWYQLKPKVAGHSCEGLS